MRMEQPIAAQKDEIRVEYRQFGLRDEEADDAFQALGVPDDGVLVGPGTAAFLSDGNDHYAQVRFESWLYEPSPPSVPWDVEEGIDELIELPSGVVRLWELVGGPSPNSFRVGPAGSYRLRIHVRSLMTAVADDEVAPDETAGCRAERWLLRFWPAT
ncbi:hypothetical protein WEI85_20225 [Actinomycetes bacterium KLBMP 9797]